MSRSRRSTVRHNGAKCAPRSREFLQVFNGAQGMLVYGVAVVKIAHDERIDSSEFRQGFREQAETVHRPQGERREGPAKNFTEIRPSDPRVPVLQLRMQHDVRDAAI